MEHFHPKEPSEARPDDRLLPATQSELPGTEGLRQAKVASNTPPSSSTKTPEGLADPMLSLAAEAESRPPQDGRNFPGNPGGLPAPEGEQKQSRLASKGSAVDFDGGDGSDHWAEIRAEIRAELLRDEDAQIEAFQKKHAQQLANDPALRERLERYQRELAELVEREFGTGRSPAHEPSSED